MQESAASVVATSELSSELEDLELEDLELETEFFPASEMSWELLSVSEMEEGGLNNYSIAKL